MDPNNAPTNTTPMVWPVIGTGLKGIGIDTCARTPINNDPIITEKIFSSITSGSHVSYHKNWVVSNQSGLVVFIEKEMWKLNSDKDMTFGYFNFRQATKCNYSNNWKLGVPQNFVENFNLSSISSGDKISINGSSQKVSEVLRSFGVKEPLREVWPIAKIENEVIWIPGVRKSDLVKDFDSENNKHIITTSIEKSNFESI